MKSWYNDFIGAQLYPKSAETNTTYDHIVPKKCGEDYDHVIRL